MKAGSAASLSIDPTLVSRPFAQELQIMTAGPGYPLEGLKVLDFSRVLAGPFAGRMLSDLGAEVVKAG